MEYPKIETLFQRDSNFKVIPTQIKNPCYPLIKEWQFTEKIDGMNIRLLWTPTVFKVSGRTDAAQLSPDLLEYLYKLIPIEKFNAVFLKGENPDIIVTIYGEGFGAGIQKGSYYSKTKQFRVFDIKINDTWLNWENVKNISEKLGIKTVPLIKECSLEEGIDIVKNGFYSEVAKEITGELYKAEGLVGRPKEVLYDNRKNRIIFKLKTKDF